MTNKQGLYFIAILLQERTNNEITRFKADFATRFNSSRALKVVPHITLKAPFATGKEKQAELVSWFQRVPVPVAPFTIELKNFGAFHNKANPVIFVQPVINTALLTLQTVVINSFRQNHPVLVHATDLNFHPHITIAYRDLSPARFMEAWEEYKTKKYVAAVEVNSFHLLQHDTKQWKVLATHILHG